MVEDPVSEQESLEFWAYIGGDTSEYALAAEWGIRANMDDRELHVVADGIIAEAAEQGFKVTGVFVAVKRLAAGDGKGFRNNHYHEYLRESYDRDLKLKAEQEQLHRDETEWD